MAKMTVYHGGYISVENPQVRIGRNTKDFGTGFYCTVIKEQAQRWAKRYDTKVVSIYEVRLNLDLNIKEFQEMTEEWLDFIIDCRSGKSHNYDIVIGAMADDQIYVVENGYINNVLDLMKTPFDRPYKFSLIFTYEEQVKFVKIINNIKNNALVT